MLDYDKISEEFTKVLNSYTDEEFYEWIEMDRKRMALLEEEEKRSSQIATRPRRSAARPNVAGRSVLRSNTELVPA